MTTCEDDLIAKAARGDQEAFQRLWEAHHGVAMAAALRLCHARALAEEITQGAFLLAWRGLPRFQLGSPFRPWLMRILYRHALDVVEKQKMHLHPLSLEDVSEEEYCRQVGVSRQMADPQAYIAEREEIRQALAKLSAEQRQVIALRYGADLTEVDIAAVLGWPVGTVKSRLNRARERLRTVLEKRGYAPMHEWDASQSRREERVELEDRLAAYYGPELPEVLLPSSSWLQLRSQLAPQRPSGRKGRLLHWPRRPRYGPGRSVPSSIADAFSDLVYEARLPYSASILHCTFRANVRLPKVRVVPLVRRKIRLLLPTDPTRLLEPPELDLLLATGVARYHCRFVRKSSYVPVSLLSLIGGVLAVLSILLLGIEHLPLLVIPIVILPFLVWMMHRAARKSAFQADVLVARWLGRSRACQGLHALAKRSRDPHARGWGEVSLAERIERVCGMRVALEDEGYTVVGGDHSGLLEKGKAR